MEECSDIFHAGGGALLYLTEPMRKKYWTTLVWDHPLSKYASCDRFFNPLMLYAIVHILDDIPYIPPVAYIFNGWLISQPKTNKNIEISYSLK